MKPLFTEKVGLNLSLYENDEIIFDKRYDEVLDNYQLKTWNWRYACQTIVSDYVNEDVTEKMMKSSKTTQVFQTLISI